MEEIEFVIETIDKLSNCVFGDLETKEKFRANIWSCILMCCNLYEQDNKSKKVIQYQENVCRNIVDENNKRRK